jgi:gliding motility-associated-like protein
MKTPILKRILALGALVSGLGLATLSAQTHSTPVNETPRLPNSLANVFTPNGDGSNDVYIPAASSLPQYRIWVYNRYGQLVFEGNQHNPWDGTNNGRQAPEGVYVFRLEGTTTTGQHLDRSGTLTLIR